jgi:glycosyltransferase involved in cell wall biosynthesis
MKLSVAIPCWSMNGKGASMLEHSFSILEQQSFKEFEVVVTDHSVDSDIEDLCSKWSKQLTINYIRNVEMRGNPAQNTNLGIKNCIGDYVKLLCQDDFLFGNDALDKVYENISRTNYKWMFMSYWHSQDRVNLYRYYIPYLSENISLVNTLGTPSALTIKNEDFMEFDINLKSMYDCEFYGRMIKRYGGPLIINDVTMVNYLHENQTTNTVVNSSLLANEEDYIRRKLCLI